MMQDTLISPGPPPLMLSAADSALDLIDFIATAVRGVDTIDVTPAMREAWRSHLRRVLPDAGSAGQDVVRKCGNDARPDPTGVGSIGRLPADGDRTDVGDRPPRGSPVRRSRASAGSICTAGNGARRDARRACAVARRVSASRAVRSASGRRRLVQENRRRS